MSVFRFSAVPRGSDDHLETGKVVARDKLEAFDKLTRRNFVNIELRKMQGMQAFFGRLTAEVR